MAWEVTLISVADAKRSNDIMPKVCETNGIKLPEEIRASDLKRPSWKSKIKCFYDKEFELWHTERFGWCIPTLLISRNTRGVNPDRTYATSVEGSNCSIGRGPHVKATVRIYVTDKNLKRLQKFLDIREKGQAFAGETRDRISTRRMNTRHRRSMW